MPLTEAPIVDLSEGSLVEHVARREEAAVAALYDTYGDDVYRFVYRRVGGRREDAEEITQDTFLSAVALAPTYDGSSSVWTWLCGIAKVRIADFRRREGRKKRVPPDKLISLEEATRGQVSGEGAQAVTEVALDRYGAHQATERIVHSLTDEECEVLLLRYVDELSLREIATSVGRTEKAVEHMVARARKKAATTVADWMRGG